MVTPNAGAIGRSEEHRKSNRRAPTHVEGRHFFGRICPCVQTTELRTTDNPSATAVTPDPNPSSNQLSVAGYSRTYCLECCPHRTTYGSQVERTASKTHALSEVLPNIIPSRCAIKEGQQPKPSHNDAKSLPLHIYVRVHCDYDTSSWREWLVPREDFQRHSHSLRTYVGISATSLYKTNDVIPNTLS